MEKEDRTYERINNYIASIILGVSFCTLIILLSIKICKTNAVTYEHTIVVADSVLTKQNVSSNTSAVIDSLKQIIEQHEQLIKYQYQDVLEHKKEESNLYSIVTIVIGVIISVLGFFGFKSYQSIEEKAKEKAEEKTKEFLKEHLNSMLKEQIQENFLKTISDTAMTSIRDTIMKDIVPTEERMETFSNNLERLQIQLYELLKKMSRFDNAWEKKFNETLSSYENSEGNDSEIINQESNKEDNPFD